MAYLFALKSIGTTPRIPARALPYGWASKV
jgi:hypothetical protein